MPTKIQSNIEDVELVIKFDSEDVEKENPIMFMDFYNEEQAKSMYDFLLEMELIPDQSIVPSSKIIEPRPINSIDLENFESVEEKVKHLKYSLRLREREKKAQPILDHSSLMVSRQIVLNGSRIRFNNISRFPKEDYLLESSIEPETIVDLVMDLIKDQEFDSNDEKAKFAAELTLLFDEYLDKRVEEIKAEEQKRRAILKKAKEPGIELEGTANSTAIMAMETVLEEFLDEDRIESILGNGSSISISGREEELRGRLLEKNQSYEEKLEKIIENAKKRKRRTSRYNREIREEGPDFFIHFNNKTQRESFNRLFGVKQAKILTFSGFSSENRVSGRNRLKNSEFEDTKYAEIPESDTVFPSSVFKLDDANQSRRILRHDLSPARGVLNYINMQGYLHKFLEAEFSDERIFDNLPVNMLVALNQIKILHADKLSDRHKEQLDGIISILNFDENELDDLSSIEGRQSHIDTFLANIEEVFKKKSESTLHNSDFEDLVHFLSKKGLINRELHNSLAVLHDGVISLTRGEEPQKLPEQGLEREEIVERKGFLSQMVGFLNKEKESSHSGSPRKGPSAKAPRAPKISIEDKAYKMSVVRGDFDNLLYIQEEMQPSKFFDILGSKGAELQKLRDDTNLVLKYLVNSVEGSIDPFYLEFLKKIQEEFADDRLSMSDFSRKLQGLDLANIQSHITRSMNLENSEIINAYKDKISDFIDSQYEELSVELDFSDSNEETVRENEEKIRHALLRSYAKNEEGIKSLSSIKEFLLEQYQENYFLPMVEVFYKKQLSDLETKVNRVLNSNPSSLRYKGKERDLRRYLVSLKESLNLENLDIDELFSLEDKNEILAIVKDNIKQLHVAQSMKFITDRVDSVEADILDQKIKEIYRAELQKIEQQKIIGNTVNITSRKNDELKTSIVLTFSNLEARENMYRLIKGEYERLGFSSSHVNLDDKLGVVINPAIIPDLPNIGVLESEEGDLYVSFGNDEINVRIAEILGSVGKLKLYSKDKQNPEELEKDTSNEENPSNQQDYLFFDFSSDMEKTISDSSVINQDKIQPLLYEQQIDIFLNNVIEPQMDDLVGDLMTDLDSLIKQRDLNGRDDNTAIHNVANKIRNIYKNILDQAENNDIPLMSKDEKQRLSSFLTEGSEGPGMAYSKSFNNFIREKVNNEEFVSLIKRSDELDRKTRYSNFELKRLAATNFLLSGFKFIEDIVKISNLFNGWIEKNEKKIDKINGLLGEKESLKVKKLEEKDKIKTALIAELDAMNKFFRKNQFLSDAKGHVPVKFSSSVLSSMNKNNRSR